MHGVNLALKGREMVVRGRVGVLRLKGRAWRGVVMMAALLTLSGATIACTSFGITKGKDIVVGNNDDWFSAAGYLVVNKRDIARRAFLPAEKSLEWVSRYGSVTLNFNAVGIPSPGMNEAGLVVDELYPGFSPTYEPPDGRPVVDEIVWIQYQLDNCATVAEVLKTREVLRIVPYYWHSHYFVYDRGGNAATIGFVGGKMVATAIPADGVQVLANRPYAEDLGKFKSPPDANEVRPGANGPVPSATRFRIAASMVRAYADGNQATVPVEYGFKILAAASQRTTAISWIYDPVNLRIHYKTIADGKVRVVALKRFDFDGRTPMLLVDANLDQVGDISGAFEPYRLEKSRALVTQTIKDWRAHKFALHITDADVEKLIQYPETMKWTGRSTVPSMRRD